MSGILLNIENSEERPSLNVMKLRTHLVKIHSKIGNVLGLPCT